MTIIIDYILASLLFDLATYIIADKKGFKNPILWGIGGVVFTIFAIGVVFFIKDKIKEKKDNQ